MTLNEIRTSLLQQHADLAVRIEETRKAALRWSLGETAHDDVRACLAGLVDAVRAHNSREEDALRMVLPTIDAWGPARTEVMIEQHVAEHQEVYAALLDVVAPTAATDCGSASASVLRLLDRMKDHIAHEERVFLGADVLSDELKVDAFGG